MEFIRSQIAPREDLLVLAWVSGPVNGTMREFCPAHLGGRADVWKKAEQEIADGNGDILKVGARLYTDTTGEIIRVPGYPPVYDYEWFPQDQDQKYTARLVMTAWRFFSAADGAFSATTSVLEKDTTSAMNEYMQSLGKDFFSVGFAAAAIPAQNTKQLQNDVASQVSEFLKQKQEEFGEGSVIYISFGTYWWPLDPEALYALFDELIANRRPFVFAHASPLADIPKDVSSRIAASSVGLAVEWAPQDMILNHPATGWFLTHGGWNSVQESFRYGVPLIVWPLSADQPMNAVLVTLVHRAGFELMTVRTGEKGRMRPYRLHSDASLQFSVEALRNEVKELLIKMDSEEGQIVKGNVERLSKEIAKVWDEEGEASDQLERFFVKYVD